MNNNLGQKQTKPKITWVTPDYFVDCDFNSDVFLSILNYFDIHWIILLPGHNARFSESDFEEIKNLPGISVEFIYWRCRARSPKMLLFYEKVYKRISYLKSDLVYFNYVPTSPYILPLYWRLNKKKTIVTAHDGNVKPSFKMPLISKMVFKLAFDTVDYVNIFSETQAVIFKSIFYKARIFIIPLGLKNFGKSDLPKRDDAIGFLFFGSIHSNKNVELLIEAGCNLNDQGKNGFKIAIHGSCTNWEPYAAKIKYPELFECDIRLHDNTEIAGLFAQNHYAVFPYKEMSQSGALKVAFNYGAPVIVSDLKGFTDEVEEDINGFIFRSEDVKDLERVITERLNDHAVNYEVLQDKVLKYNEAHYSTSVLADKYIDMFNEVLHN